MNSNLLLNLKKAPRNVWDFIKWGQINIRALCMNWRACEEIIINKELFYYEEITKKSSQPLKNVEIL